MDTNANSCGPLTMNFEAPQYVGQNVGALGQGIHSQASTFMQELADYAFNDNTSYHSGQGAENLAYDPAIQQQITEGVDFMPQSERASHGDQNAIEADNHEEGGEAQDEEDDLFRKTFGSKYGSHSSNAASEEDGEHGHVAMQVDNNIQPDPFMRQTPSDGANKDEHTSGCNGTRTCSTPPRPPAPAIAKPRSQTPAASAAAPRPPALAPALIRYHKLHANARTLIPRLPLPKHRYWIAVLSPEKKPQNARNEKDFIWMKGNRLTTVQTVWQMYCSATATDPEDVVILCAEEKLELTDKMCELRYCGKLKEVNLVVMQAVGAKTLEAKGRSFTANLIPPDTAEVVEIEDD